MKTRPISVGIALTIMALAATSAFASNYGNNTTKAAPVRHLNDAPPIVGWGNGGGTTVHSARKNHKMSKGKTNPGRHLNDGSAPIVGWGNGGG